VVVVAGRRSAPRHQRARLAETLGLVWDDVDLEGARVTFSYQLDRNGHRQPLKTKRSRRCLEITPGLVSTLRRHKLASPYSKSHDFVFASRAGTDSTTARSAAASSPAPSTAQVSASS
jgi:integrase